MAEGSTSQDNTIWNNGTNNVSNGFSNGQSAHQPQQNINTPSSLHNPSPLTHNQPLTSPYTNGVSLPSPAAGSSGNLSDISLLQARLAMAQQHMQADMQQRQQQIDNNANGSNGERKMSGSGMPGMQQPFNLQNAAALVATLPDGKKEEMLKQLQLLQSSQSQRARIGQGQIGLGLPPQPNANSPQTASSPSAQQGRPPLPALNIPSNAVAGPSTGLGTQMSGMQGFNALSQQQREQLIRQHQQAQQAGLQNTQQPNTAMAGLPPGMNARPPLVRPPQNPADQKRFFTNSLRVFLQAHQIPLPPEAYENGQRECALKIGEEWLDLVDLFLFIIRAGGLQQLNSQPNAAAKWAEFIASKNLPQMLPAPVPLPQPFGPPAQSSPIMTEHTIPYLMAFHRKYMIGFEQHMMQKKAPMQKNGPTMMTAGRPPPVGTPGQDGTAMNGMTAPSPSHMSAPSPVTIASFNAPSPAQFPPVSTPVQAQTARPVPSPINVSSPAQTMSQPNSAVGADTPTGPPKKKKGRPKGSKNSTTTTRTDSPRVTSAQSAVTQAQKQMQQQPQAPAQQFATFLQQQQQQQMQNQLGHSPAVGQKRPGADTQPKPPTPKRTRYKVEYQPLHIPQVNLGGWDERAVASTFPKNDQMHPPRPLNELGVVDMDGVLMSLRSRLPKELGYSLTVLSMLSMPYPEERSVGLPLVQLRDIYIELLDLLEEAVFGEDGYEAWDEAISSTQLADDPEASIAKDKVDLSSLSSLDYFAMERLGTHVDYSVPDDEDETAAWRKERTGGSTDIILATLNLLRNLSMLPENRTIMTQYPQFFILLSRVVDPRLARSPTDPVRSSLHQPYSILELARVRRDVIVILANTGGNINLKGVSMSSILPIFRLLTVYLNSGFDIVAAKETVYGPSRSIQEVPQNLTQSIFRALEAFSQLARRDGNREVLGALPQDELVTLFQSLVKMFPMTKRADEAMHISEEYLGHVELLGMSLYSIAFLAPIPTRTLMRNTPGATALMSKIIWDGVHSGGADFARNPFGVLCRRLVETLGVLNGTTSPSGDSSDGAALASVNFGAGAGGGKGWKWSSGVVAPGWMALEGDRICETLTGMRNTDKTFFNELDALWWGAE